MATVMIIGAGGVGRVVSHKCALVPEVFSRIVLASRTISKCEQIRDEIIAKGLKTITVRQVDADDVAVLVALMAEVKPELVINVALPYQDLTIMEACLQAGVNYLDTANYEHPDTASFEYKEQWALHERFKEAGLMALLGSGFDPGVTNVFCAYGQQQFFDEINEIDILDCNDGDHGYPFATNFNPEINIREVTAKGRYWQDGEWIETEPLSVRLDHDYPEIGVRPSYLMYHEELESLCRHIKGLKRIRFFMTFSDSYLTHLRVLENVGMTSIEEVEHNGCKIVPLQFLKTLLPDPASLGARTKGRTNIGCLMTGVKGGRMRRIYLYNICDHEACWAEVGSQAVSYTTGVPAMIGAMLMLKGDWQGLGVFNMEEFDATPFMDELMKHGLPWTVLEIDVNGWTAPSLSLVPSPCFVLEEERLRANLEILATVQQASGARILHALKAFAMFSVFDLISSALCGAAASGLHEARLAREKMAGEVHTFCPAIKDNDFAELVQISDQLIFNSLHQWHRLREQAALYPDTHFGLWQDSGGDRSFFGLTASEIIEMVDLLRADDKLHCLQMLHYHIGSQVPNIRNIRTGISEAARFYVNLVKEGVPMEILDVGGGLAVDYDGSHTNFESSRNYSLHEYCSDIVEVVKSVTDDAGVPHPVLVSESGRATVAHHEVLLFNVLEVCQLASHLPVQEFPIDSHDLLQKLHELEQTISTKNLQEWFHDATYYLEEIRTLFRHGVIPLRQRALAEEIFWAIIEKINSEVKNKKFVPEELKNLNSVIADTY